ncbi:MAG: hypothetical protein AMXMBFR64_37640 [Myxococcales bacterium]
MTPEERDRRLLESFKRWDESGKGLRVGPNLPPEEDEGEDDIASALARARRGRSMRTAALVVILLVSALSLWSTRRDAAYFFADSKPVELGNVRDLYAQGKGLADVAQGGSYVHVEGLAITQVAETDKYLYFLDPISDTIVRTRRELPEKSRLMTIPIDDRLVPLLQDRRLFPHDLTASFEAKGRLVRLVEAPGWARNIVQFYGGSLHTPLDRAFLLVDGEEPGDNAIYVGLYAVALLLVGSASVFLVRAIRRERELREAIERGR